MRAPRLSQRSISVLERIVTGDPVDRSGTGPIAPYNSGPKLVEFFNAFGSNDVYPARGGFPSRASFARDKLNSLNGTPQFSRVVEAAFSAARFLDTDYELSTAVDCFNRYVGLDGYELVATSKGYRLRSTGEQQVEIDSKLE